MQIKEPKKIVVIGGGTGTYTVLSGLKRYPSDMLDLTAIVTVADSGGSTGRLRDEFGYLPVGDFRQALAALADDSEASTILRNLFSHRFDKGGCFVGHNFGNLFLIAMTDIAGSEEKAIELASKVLRVRGKVLPVSREKLTLVARYEDGTIVRGEAEIDEPAEKSNGYQRICELWVEPEAKITPQARVAIQEAHAVIVGPGDLYTSILANIVVPGVKEALRTSKAKLFYIANLMTKYGQTHNFTVQDHVQELKRYTDRMPSCVLVNNSPLPENICSRYKEQYEFPVKDDVGSEFFHVVRGDFLAQEEIKKSSGDSLRRSLIRHDSEKLAHAIVSLL